jgi:hypothetical protein
MTGTQDLTLITAPPTTIQTNPPGLQLSVDGLPEQTAPVTLELSPGPHLMSVPTPQPGIPGTQYVFTGWNDAIAASHNIAVTGTAAIYTASFKTQYQLTTSSLPAPGGAVTPASGSFYDAGSDVALTATAIAPYTFGSWGGAASGNANPTSITMSAAKSVTATFSVPGFTCDLNGDTFTDVKDVQLSVNEALGAAAPVHDLNRDNVVNVVDVQKTIDAALGLGCLY